VIMVTARTEETDAVLGLDLGADDYIRKPFSPRELVARLRVVLRRRLSGSESARQGNLVAGAVILERDAHRALSDGKDIGLTATEFGLLLLFMQNPDMAFSRNQLIDRVWGTGVYVNDRTVDVTVKRLREKLGSERERIETLRGVGYRFRGTSDGHTGQGGPP